MRNKREIEKILDSVTDRIRDQEFDHETVDLAANRVWANIVAERNVKTMIKETPNQIEHIKAVPIFNRLYQSIYAVI
jgi:hypothetical protein